ncbi:MAG: glutathione peroxidase [Nannocystaceae bacterium]|nr:glutathione peroxidase [Nannocystaceae bacterium]
MNRALVLLVLLSACDSAAPVSAASADAPGAADGVKAGGETKTAGAKPTPAKAAAPVAQGPVLDHIVKTIKGEDKSLADFRGKALLVVNTASQCGYTPQYEGLQELYAKYKARGFEVLAFPSNDFGGQEPGSEDEISGFVDETYGVQFPMFAKVPVKGDAKAPLFTTITEQTPEGIKGEIKWNFTKFLVDPSGRVVARYESNVDPMDTDLTARLESILPSA